MRNEELGLLRQLAAPPRPKKSLPQAMNELRERKLRPPPEGIGQLLIPDFDDEQMEPTR